MRWIWRRLKKGEQDVELVLGVLFLPLLGLTALFVVKFLPESLVPPCAFRALTGIPCPTCGAYRCTALLAQGRVREAWLTQPLFANLVALALFYAIYSVCVVALKSPRLRLEGWQARHTRALLAGLAVLALLNWAWLIWRLPPV